jgi:hypothetical protein
MPTVNSIVAQLQRNGSEKTRITYARHGMAIERTYGVSVAQLKTIAKTIRKQQTLACELYATGMMEAMYLAGIVSDGALLSRDQLNQWAAGAAGLPMIAETTVPWVAVENPHGRLLALEWINTGKATTTSDEQVASSGWNTYAGIIITQPDQALDLREIESLLDLIAETIHQAPNRARYTMNGFVNAIGCYVAPLRTVAIATAAKIGPVFVDMGDTACELPTLSGQMAKMEKAGKLGQKRKTIRC